ncbi:uncharacterized protein LOC134935027 [Pseudophryne corroboree]|uniref:uncharacterized protein LOC134935027 n=1 Tax=Pseudophryne corroboree TaxID=495146 RepID=UPI0030821204
MLGRYRKLTFGTLCNKERSGGCVLIGRTAVYRRLMDPPTECSDPAVSHNAQLASNHGGSREYTVKRNCFEKSMSEDSGVEIPPPSPFGSESSYNPDEPEGLESSTPEYSETPESSASEDPDSLQSSGYGKQDSFSHSGETHTLEHSAFKSPRSFTMHPQKDIDRLEYVRSQQQERDTSGVPHKLEQAVLRSRRPRSNSRDSIQSRIARHNRKYPGSLKEQCRGKTCSHQARSPTRPREENKDQDPLPLPGDGLRYLESLCDMLEQIAELQQRNLKLQHEKRETEERLRNRVLLLDSCVCGGSQACRDSDNDLTDNSPPIGGTWAAQHYRKRSTSHAGMLLGLNRPTGGTLREADKMEPQYVSVPNLQVGDRPGAMPHYKTEVSQWYKVKDMLSKLAGKSAVPSAVQGGTHTAQPHYNCRTQHPRRLFLPGLVIRPRNHSQQFR